MLVLAQGGDLVDEASFGAAYFGGHLCAQLGDAGFVVGLLGEVGEFVGVALEVVQLVEVVDERAPGPKIFRKSW